MGGGQKHSVHCTKLHIKLVNILWYNNTVTSVVIFSTRQKWFAFLLGKRHMRLTLCKLMCNFTESES